MSDFNHDSLNFLFGSFLFMSIILLILLTYIVVCRSVLSAIIATSIISLCMTIYYIILDAPDVALTEAAVGGCAGTAILYLTLIKERDFIKSTNDNKHLLFVLCTIVFAIFIKAKSDIPIFGDETNIIHHHIVPHYIKFSGLETGIRSLVSSILASYRGFDTYGETSVIAIGGISIGYILGRENNDNA